MRSTASNLPWLKIALTPGIGPTSFRNLIERFGSPEEVLGKSEEELLRAGNLKPTAARSLLVTADGRRDDEALREMETLERKGIRLLDCRDPLFPQNLAEIPNPPALLFVRGTLEREDANALGIVGTRRCDSYGLRTTREIVVQMTASRLTVVSGLALGIDTAAHQAALSSGGRTWAFLASGFGTIYPPENESLSNQIAESGALLTEFTYHEKALPRNFPSRNRLLSGAALGVLVVQAPCKSGALITARFAVEQNREVFAVPGRVDNPSSEGPHRLIQDGAKLVHNAADILEELKPRLLPRSEEKKDISPDRTGRDPAPSEPAAREEESPAPRPRGRRLSPESLGKLEPDDRRIVLRLEPGPVHIDRIAADLELPVRRVGERLLILEMNGLVRRLPGMSFDLPDRLGYIKGE